MRKNVHKGLAQLVGSYGTVLIDSNILKMLKISSVEPDSINKQEISKKLINFLTIPIKWFINHTIRAKKLAYHYIQEARTAYINGYSYWPRLLGWGFHFIVDWVTPHHSPISKSNPILKSAINNFFSGMSRGSQYSNKLGDQVKSGILNMGLNVIIGAVKLSLSHKDFEIICDKRWNKCYPLIKKIFLTKLKGQRDSPNFESFEIKINQLRHKCNNLAPDWIIKSEDFDFADYMSEIAIVLDMIVQIVL